MTIRALRDDYHGEFKDSLEKFGGAQLVYLGWDKHQMFCSSRAFPLPPEMHFQELLDNVMPEGSTQSSLKLTGIKPSGYSTTVYSNLITAKP